MPAHALALLQGCTSVSECSSVQLHERLFSLPVGCLQMNAGFQVAACSPVLSESRNTEPVQPECQSGSSI